MNEKTKEPVYAVAEMEFRDAEFLKSLFTAISRIADEPIFNITVDSIQVRQMDSSRVSMIDYVIKKEYFESWHVHTPGICSFNIDQVLKTAFGNLTKDTSVTIFIDSKDQKITFTLKDKRVRQRTFPLLEYVLEKVPAPKLTYDARFKLVAKEFHNDLEELQKTSDCINLVATNNVLRLEAIGEIAHATNKYERGSDILLTAEVTKETKAGYILSYLVDVMIDPKLCDIITLEFTTDRPLKVTMQTPIGALISYLAPRIKTD